MPFSKVVNETEKDLHGRIFSRLHAIKRQQAELAREEAELLYLRDNILKQCKRCGGGGTVCEGRTADDMPNYQVCPQCGGIGHSRGRP